MSESQATQKKPDWSLRILAVLFSVAVLGAAATAFSLWPRTDYSPGYAEDAFDQLASGAKVEEVEAALGDPFETREDRTNGDLRTTFFYSRPAAGYENYRVRAVVFDGRGMLIEKVAETHID